MVPDALAPLLDYLSTLSPVLALFAAWFWITPRSQTGLRLAIVLIAFICARDMMTPYKLWAIGGHPILQFHASARILVVLGVTSMLLIGCLAKAAPELWRLIIGFKGNRGTGLAIGLAAGCAIGLPLRLYQGVEMAPAVWMLGFVVLAFGGNALEEVLFRGALQGLLETATSPQRAAIGSGIAFSACHAHLAFILTHAGWPVIVFTFIEGLVCAQVRLKWGTIPAVVTHGTAITLLGAPLL